MDKTDLLKGFNNHITEFFNDVLTIFPNDDEINTAYASISAIRKFNPKLIITVWKKYIADNYRNEIEIGDIDFFINRSYKNDFKDTNNASSILDKIDTLREPIKQMGHDNKEKTIKYIQNLTKLCILYHK